MSAADQEEIDMSTHFETNQRLDAIAEAIGSNGASAELLNAVHACRPGHPLNARARNPFFNLQFMLAGQRCRTAIPYEHRDWLDRAAADEREAVAQ